MPYRRKDSVYWWVHLSPPGSRKTIRKSTGTTDWKEAKALEGKWKAELFRQEAWDEDPPRLFADVAAEYLVSRQDLRSHEDIKRRVAKLYDFFGADKNMETLSGQDVRDFIKWRREPDNKGRVAAPATVNRELDCLSAMINHAVVEMEWRIPNPTRGRSLKEPKGRVRWITRAEAARLIQCAEGLKDGERLASFITLALHTGCRMSELLELEWRRVNFKNALITLEPDHDKAGNRRTVPLNDVALNALRRRAAFVAKHCPGSPWVFAMRNGERLSTPRGGFKTACKAAGIADFRIHDMRHTCASWMVSEGVPLADVKEVLGHSTITMTEKYAHLAPHRARDAVAKLSSRKSEPAEDLSRSCHGERPANVLESLVGRKRR
jgi:integrase